MTKRKTAKHGAATKARKAAPRAHRSAAPRPEPESTRRRANVREVAELAGVAISSVSRVLSKHPDVSSTMRDRVVAAVDQLGYEPDFLAQSLRRGSTLSVGFVVGDITNPVMADLAHGAEGVLRAAGYSMQLMNSDGNPELDEAHIRFFQSRRVDGMLLSLASEKRRATLQLLAQIKVPVVVLDREVPAYIGANAVLSDHRAGMRAATEYLIDLGHRRIALITASLEMRAGRERVGGMRDAVKARGIPDETVALPGSLLAEHGEAATNELFSQRRPPTAVIAGGNQILIGTLRALTARGVRVGEDVALVTCDDFPLAELYSPPIATITRDTVGMGRAAAQLLLARLERPQEPATVILPTTFRARASASPPRGPRRASEQRVLVSR
jgi:LacI family transcriptional regulator